jgi:hypothetical protein
VFTVTLLFVPSHAKEMPVPASILKVVEDEAEYLSVPSIFIAL